MIDQLMLLIRLHNQTLDLKRLEKSTLDQQIAQLRLALEMLAEELQKEQEAAAQSEEVRHAYARYALQAQERRDQLDHELTTLEDRAEKLLHVIQEIYADIKRYEKAVADLNANAASRQRQREAARMDEIVTRQYNDQLAEG